MRSKIIATALLAAMALAGAGCRKGGDAVVPRREAFPRVAEYDSAYVAIDSLPVRLEVNAQAQASVSRHDDGSVWVDVSYPKYKAQLFCTLTALNGENALEVIDNRFERMWLNLGGRVPDHYEEFDNPAGFAGVLLYEPSVVSTPVQFVAAPVSEEGTGWAVSATAFFYDVTADTPVDSVAPMSAVLYRDVNHMIEQLR